jgi:hypothetical protein
VSAETHQAIEREIVSERAGSLARAVEALEKALESFHAAAGALREHLREQAGERLWYVVVQREAIGLTRHEVLYEVLRVPAEVRRIMGPARGIPPLPTPRSGERGLERVGERGG